MTYIDTVPPPPLRAVCCAQARTFGKKIDPGAAASTLRSEGALRGGLLAPQPQPLRMSRRKNL